MRATGWERDISLPHGSLSLRFTSVEKHPVPNP